MIGRGSFATVHIAKFHYELVAVKKLTVTEEKADQVSIQRELKTLEKTQSHDYLIKYLVSKQIQTK